MLCEHAIELLKELKHNQWLPAYNDELVQQVLRNEQETYDALLRVSALISEFDQLPKDVQEQQQEEKLVIAANMTVHEAIFKRNKRCVLAYINERLNRIKQMHRESSGSIEGIFREKMSPLEHNFLDEFAQLQTEYNAAIGLDLGSDLHPPKDQYVQVKVVRDYGKIMTSTGMLNLVKNSVYFLSEQDADPLIQKGIVKPVRTQ